ncbi:alpha-mannosidase [Saccharibacillus sp. JS10]|uniref:alpha-mannosidase n=1 Tax=Saccharibacillus sp. JS10 TaxID=2950552 RepID=UPI0021094228|nr:alpha-mannosidase [Saccharibacillus sp. JS10]MCQ4085644.1 alpha-mannosidase [Saccharibacillus sp. JS10]
MFSTEEKLAKRITELEPYRYRDSIELNEWAGLEDEEGANGAYPPASFKTGRTYNVGDHWSGRDRYLWLQRSIDIPAEWTGRRIVGLFDFGRTGDFYNSGFESLLFIDGHPYQGVDSNHLEVFLEADAVGRTFDFSFRLWSGLEGGGLPKLQEHVIGFAKLTWLDESADNLYYTARAVLGVYRELPDNHALKPQLLAMLDKSIRLVDWSKPGSAAFYESAQEADRDLEQRISQLERHPHPVQVTAVGHTHIDVAWMWRLTHTREKAARSFSTVLRLMRQFPEYVFLQTQPQLYDYIKQDYPELYTQIAEKVQEGRWEAGGAMWLEADCNLTSGESLVRQILYGTQFFREEFGVECKHLWLPDVFGYSWALPQILRKSGIETFMTTKLGWNQYNKMPHDTFYWRGIDGSEVLTHFITTRAKPLSQGITYNGVIEAFSVQGIWDLYLDKNLNQELLLAYGYGDGGGGVNRDMLEMRRRLDNLPGIPSVKPGRADDYFGRLNETISNTEEYVHTWDGELYLETHRGTYTSQAHNKKMNRKLELDYRTAEWLQILAAAEKGSLNDYPAERLLEGWKIVLRNQFHDIIPGSGIREVYEDSRLEYEEAKQIVDSVIEEAAAALIPGSASNQGVHAQNAQAYTLFSGAFFTYEGLVQIRTDTAENQSWSDYQGQPLRAQRLSEQEWLVEVPELTSLGATVIYATPATQPVEAQSPFVWKENQLTTPFYILEWNASGQLQRIFDREAKREVLKEGEPGNVLQVFEDKPMEYDAWNIDIEYLEKSRYITDLISTEVIQNGELSTTVQIKWKYMDSTVTQSMTLYASQRQIEFDTTVDWHEQHQLLKVAFPVSIRSTEATYDIQFGNVKRPTHWNTSWDYARFETVGHQWADLSERDYGVSLLNDCKYGYDIKDHVMRLTLIKSATDPDWSADQGIHTFNYALLPHAGDWVAGGTAEKAWALNDQPQIVKGAYEAGVNRSLLRMDTAGIAIDAIKRSEQGDTWIIRLHEYTGRRVEVKLSSDYDVSSWQLCDLLERPLEKEVTGSEYTQFFKPYEIITLQVKMG